MNLNSCLQRVEKRHFVPTLRRAAHRLFTMGEYELEQKLGMEKDILWDLQLILSSEISTQIDDRIVSCIKEKLQAVSIDTAIEIMISNARCTPLTLLKRIKESKNG